MLSADRALIDLIRDSLAGMHRVWRADDAAHAGELIVAASKPVLLIDAPLADSGTRGLVDRVREQFPDLAIIAAGPRNDEASLAPLLASGVLFGCLGHPATADTILNFVEATQRQPGTNSGMRPVALRSPRAPDRRARQPFKLPKFTLPRIALPRTSLPKIRVNRAWIRRWSGRCMRLAAVSATAWVLLQFKPWNPIAELFAGPERAPPVVIDRETQVQQLLDAAALALSRGRLVDPPERNALELYRAALALDPTNIPAKRGIDSVADKLLVEADQALQARDLPRLASAIDAARSARPDHPLLPHYSQQLKFERERKFGPEKPRGVQPAG